jgi:hypothetical protein
MLSFLRRQESSLFNALWTAAFAGVTANWNFVAILLEMIPALQGTRFISREAIIGEARMACQSRCPQFSFLAEEDEFREAFIYN